MDQLVASLRRTPGLRVHWLYRENFITPAARGPGESDTVISRHAILQPARFTSKLKGDQALDTASEMLQSKQVEVEREGTSLRVRSEIRKPGDERSANARFLDALARAIKPAKRFVNTAPGHPPQPTKTKTPRT